MWAAQCAPRPPDMVGWWPLDEQTGSLVSDVSGYNHPGTTPGGPVGPVGSGGPQPVPGFVQPSGLLSGGAFFFANNTDFVQVPNSSDLNFGGGSFSIDAWINLTVQCAVDGNSNLNLSSIVDKWDPSGYGYRLYVRHYNSVNELYFALGNGSQYYLASAIIPSSGWVHVTAVFDISTSPTARLYINGSPVTVTFSPSSAPITVNINNAVDLLIGGMTNLNAGGLPPMPPGATQFVGHCEFTVDEVEIFKRTVRQDEIRAIYDAKQAGKCRCATPPQCMVGWWSLDEQTGATQIIDNWVYNNIGTPKDTSGSVAPVGGGSGPVSVSGEVPGSAFTFGSLFFNNVNYVQVPDSSSLRCDGICPFSVSPGLSIDAWIKPMTNGPLVGCGSAWYSPIVDKWDPLGSGKGYTLFLKDDGNNGAVLVFDLSDNSGPHYGGQFPITAGDLNSNGWVHVAAVLDSSSAHIATLYINGSPVIISPAPVGSFSNSNDLIIGGMASLPIGIGKCEIALDEVEIFCSALQPNEIKAIYDAKEAGKCKTECTKVPGGIIGWWPFNNVYTNNPTITPSIIGINPGTLQGTPLPVLNAGYAGNSLLFNGSNWVRVPNNGSLNIGLAPASFTVDAWVKPSDISGVKTIIDKRGACSVGGGAECGYHVFLYNGQLGVRLADGTAGFNSGGTNYYDPSISVPVDPYWHFVGVAVDRLNNKMTLRVDGNSVTQPFSHWWSSPGWHIGSLANTADLLIGSRNSNFGSGGAFIGGIDEVEIFKRALPDAKLALIYNACWKGKCRKTVRVSPAVLSGPVVADTGTMAFTFDNVTTEGDLTEVEISEPSPPQSFRIPSGSSYYITFTGAFSSDGGHPIIVCVPIPDEDDGIANITGNESNLKLVQRINSEWVNITAAGYPNIVNNMICGETTSLSEFAVVEPESEMIPASAFSWTADLITSFKVNFTASGCPTGHTCAYDWDFGDLNSGTGATTSHIYANSSVATVTLTVTDSTTGYKSAPYANTVLPVFRNSAPTAAGTITQSGWTVTVIDNSTDLETAQSALEVTIDWGNGSTSTGNGGETFTKTYAALGTYIIKQRVRDEGRKLSYAANTAVTVPVKYAVSGKVLRLDGTTPVSGASIRLKKGATVVKMTTTNASGNYTLTDVLPEAYTVEAVKSGLTFSSTPAANVVNTNITVSDIKATR
ncbi:MAG: LamG-like jellyroll fold domain-containing protein [Thermodesulfovibrionales bacterium]